MHGLVSRLLVEFLLYSISPSDSLSPKPQQNMNLQEQNRDMRINKQLVF